MLKKRIISAALVLVMAIGFAGCGQNTNETADAHKKSGTGTRAAEAVGAEEADGAYTADAKGLAEADAATGAVDDAKMKTEAAEIDGDEYAFSLDAEGSTADGTATFDIAQRPEAGQLTAGRWTDNDNWGFFANLVNSGAITFPSFGINPTARTAVTVKDKSGSPVVNAKAVLKDASGAVLWTGVTDKSGKVYLFTQSGTPASVEIESGGKKQSYNVSAPSGGTQEKTAQLATNVDTEVVFDGSGKSYKNLDIMFIVDTTGSMADEMLFLQSEFTAITKAAGDANTRYSVNFYRDEGDDYVTKCNGFTSDIKAVQQALNAETADGGGDYPEAVDKALTDTMNASDWREDSVKLAFLIFDAPPHEGKEKELSAAVAKAAEQGIRLIPVIASDADRDTELFGRAIAMTTGGTYVFLTDDSGIGNSHEEPIIGDYEVKTLLDTIIEIVGEYKQ